MTRRRQSRFLRPGARSLLIWINQPANVGYGRDERSRTVVPGGAQQLEGLVLGLHADGDQSPIEQYRRQSGEKVIEIIRSGETFADAVMFMEEARPYPVSAQAIVASELLAFEQAALLGILEQSTVTCMRLMAGMSRRLRQQVDEIDRLTLHNATYCLATYLLQQIPRGVLESPELHLTTPKHIVASRLATQPETFSRIFSRLAENGCVEVHGQNIVLTDIGFGFHRCGFSGRALRARRRALRSGREDHA